MALEAACVQDQTYYWLESGAFLKLIDPVNISSRAASFSTTLISTEDDDNFAGKPVER